MNSRAADLRFERRRCGLRMASCWTLVLLWFLANSPRVCADQVIFSELMVAPSPGSTAWVEVRNLTVTPFDMASWRFLGDNVSYRFPEFSAAAPQRTFLRPWERILLSAAAPEALREELGLGSEVRIFGPWKGELGGEEDRFKLQDKNGVALCEVEFDWSGSSPLEARHTGHSLLVSDVDGPIDQPMNWTWSPEKGGSPGRVSVPGSGIPVTLESTPNFDTREIFGYEGRWRFQQKGQNLNRSWVQPEFDDSDWQEGAALLGFEESGLPDPGLQTRLGRGKIAYYFRKAFDYQGPTDGVTLSIDQIVDDGVVYYLNGQRIGRVRVRGGRTIQTTTATQTITDAREEKGVVRSSGNHLRLGHNVLAAVVHQANASSTDLVFGCRLDVSVPTVGGVRITAVGLPKAGPGFLVLSNPLDTPQVLSGMGVRLSGFGDEETILKTDTLLPSGGTIHLSFDEIALALPSGSLSSIGILEAVSGRLLDRVPIIFADRGMHQERRSPTSSEWLLKREAPGFLPRSAPRPGQNETFMSEVSLGVQASQDWIELKHEAVTPLAAGTLVIALDRPEQADIAVPAMAPGAISVIELSTPVSPGDHVLYMFNSVGEVLAAHRFQVPVDGAHFQRFPVDGSEWFRGTTPTPGSSNVSPIRPTLVINEIMADPPFGNQKGEFLELWNYGTQPVDLSGARFVEGVRANFPEGSVVRPGEFVVLAAEPDWLQEAFPNLESVIPYRGKLANRGERLRLEDRYGNLIDEVRYRVEGDWPVLASGRGSSLERLHPSLDGELSSAWADSRESRKSSFRRYQFSGTFLQAARMGRASDYLELHLYLVGESHLVLRDISVQEQGGPNLLRSRLALSEDAYGDDAGWLIQGNHADSFVEGDRLHLIAHGHGDNRANRAEIDVPEMREGREYTVSFDARWVSGSPRLIAHSWDNSMAHSFRVDIPRNLGTPGRMNSRYQSVPPPQVETLQHRPSVPAPGEPVLVTARVLGVQRGAVRLFHREADAAVPWNESKMSDRGIDGDVTAADNVFSAVLEGYSEQGQVVEFFVRAESADGGDSLIPRGGESRPALMVFDERTLPTDLRMIRFVVNPRDIDAMLGWQGGGEGKYPRLSNQYFNATFISNEEKVTYGAELRRSGSPWTRSGGLSRGKWKLPKDREFRAHGKFSFDDDAAGSARHHNRIARYLLYLLGHPGCQNEFVRVVVNADSIMLREDVEPVDSDFLNRAFEDGNDGELYRIDDQWWFTDDWRQANRDAAWEHVGSDNSGWYRNAWMKRSREEDDDYSHLIEFFGLIAGGRYSAAEIDKWLDADQILRMTAVMGFIGDWDTFTQQRGKNAYFYRRAADGRFQFLQWDTDLAFRRDGRRFYGGSRAFVNWVQRPSNMARLQAALGLLNNYCNKDPERLNAWFEAESEAHPETKVNASFYRSWFSRQERKVDAFSAN